MRGTTTVLQDEMMFLLYMLLAYHTNPCRIQS